MSAPTLKQRLLEWLLDSWLFDLYAKVSFALAKVGFGPRHARISFELAHVTHKRQRGERLTPREHMICTAFDKLVVEMEKVANSSEATPLQKQCYEHFKTLARPVIK